MMALVDVLDYFPKDHPERKTLIDMVKNLSSSLIKVRDNESKLWYQVLDKGDKKGNYLEASGSLMYIYSFAKGANKGYLNKKYLYFASESFQAVTKYFLIIDKNGIVNLDKVVSVSGLGGNPYRNGSFEYYISEPIRLNDFKGYGPLILAALELERSGKLKAYNPEKKKIVGLDSYYNNEFKEGKRFHYIWGDEAFSGFSELGNTIKNLGAEITELQNPPTESELNNFSIYVIVDPDTPNETPNPHYIEKKERQVIVNWVKRGGVLVLMANDSGNCEFKNLNLLAENFGIHFNEVSENRVIGKNFDQGKLDQFPHHPIFEGISKIYLKEISSLKLSKKAIPLLKKDGKIIMACSNYGKGFIFAVGDPWLYNEYFDNRKLPTGFKNFKAGKNLFDWLLKKSGHYN
jgi:unsaturated rhamnogalacturonyl hydrolase